MMASWQKEAACLRGIVDCAARHAGPHVEYQGVNRRQEAVHRTVTRVLPFTCSANNTRSRGAVFYRRPRPTASRALWPDALTVLAVPG